MTGTAVLQQSAGKGIVVVREPLKLCAATIKLTV